jgi:hypothetical protein
MAGYKDDQVQNAFARIAQELSKKQQPKVTPYEETIGARSQVNTQDYAPRVNATELLQQYADYGDQFDNRNIGSKALNVGRRTAGAFGELFEQASGAIVNGIGAANTIGLDKNAETAFYKLQDQKNNPKYQEELAVLDDPAKAVALGGYLDLREATERKAYLTNRLQQNQLTPEEQALLYNPDGSETEAKQRLNWSNAAEDYGKRVTGDREKGIAGSFNARNWYDHTGEKAYQAHKKYNGTSPKETALAQREARDAYDQGDYFGWATKHLGTFAKSAKESANALSENPAYLLEEAAAMTPYLLPYTRMPAIVVDATRVQNDSYDAFVDRELRAPTAGESLGILGMTAVYTAANYAESVIAAGVLKGKSLSSSLGLKSSSVPSAIEKTAIDKIRNAAVVQSAGQLGRSALAEGVTEAVQQQIEVNWGSLNNTLDSAAMGEAFTMGAAITGAIGTPAATANAVLGTGLQAKAALAERNLNKAKEDSPEIDQSIPTEDFASPSSPNFNPKAATVRMTQEASQAETPEAKQEIKAKQEEVLRASASRLDILENIIESLGDVEGTRTGVEEFRAQVQSAKDTDPSNPQVAQLEEALANADAVMAEIDANANDPEYADRVKKEYSGLINQLNKATEIRNNSEALADDLSNNPTTIPSKILGAPSSYTAAELAKASKDVKYAEADREVLRTLSEARQAYDDTQSIKRVSKDIINGSDYSKPIMSYMDDMSKAVASGNTRMQEVTSKMLDRFAKSHQSKADTITQAWEAAKAAPGTVVQVARVAGENKWFINTGDTIENTRENGALNIKYNPGGYGHSESLVSAISMESNLINKVKASVDALAARSTNDTSDPMERMQQMADSLDTSNGVDLEAQQLADEGRQQQAQANQAKGKSTPQNTPVNPDENIWEGIDESSLQLEPVDLDSIKPDLSNTEIQFDDSGVGSVVPTTTQPSGTTPETKGVVLTGKSSYLAKHQAKADKATKFIGQGSAQSSTAQYAKDFGESANTGTYTSDDVVFVSAESNREDRIPFDKAELHKAIEAGAIIITDDAHNRKRTDNVGVREVAAELALKGYEEVSPGEWKPKKKSNAPVVNTPKKGEEEDSEETTKLEYLTVPTELLNTSFSLHDPELKDLIFKIKGKKENTGDLNYLDELYDFLVEAADGNAGIHVFTDVESIPFDYVKVLANSERYSNGHTTFHIRIPELGDIPMIYIDLRDGGELISRTSSPQEAFAHEIHHTVTMQNLDSSSEIQDEINNVLKPRLVDHIEQNRERLEKEDPRTLSRLEYMLINNAEFITVGTTEYGAIQELKKISVPVDRSKAKTSMFKRLVQLIGKTVGMPNEVTNVYEKLLDQTAQLKEQAYVENQGELSNLNANADTTPVVNTPKMVRKVNDKGDIQFTGLTSPQYRELKPLTIKFNKQDDGSYISSSKVIELNGVTTDNPDATIKEWLDKGELFEIDATNPQTYNKYFIRDPKTSVLTPNGKSVVDYHKVEDSITYLMDDGLVLKQTDPTTIKIMLDQVLDGIAFDLDLTVKFTTKGIANKEESHAPFLRLTTVQFKELEKQKQLTLESLAKIVHPDRSYESLVIERAKAFIKDRNIKILTDKPNKSDTLVFDTSVDGWTKVGDNFHINPYASWKNNRDKHSLFTQVQNSILATMGSDPRVTAAYVPATFEGSTPEVDALLAAIRGDKKPIKKETPDDNLPTQEVRKFDGIEYIVDSTIPTMARTDKNNNITLNPRDAENSKEFWDYFGGVVQEDAPVRTKQASQQKKLVLAKLGVYGYSLDYLKQQLNTPRKLNEFLLRHEQSHIDNNDRAVYYSNGESLLTDDKVAIETRATLNALTAMGIEPKYEGNIDESFVSTSETPYEIYDIPLNENELKDMFGGLDTTTEYVPDFGTTVAANKEAQALREANKDLPLAEHDLVREAVNIVPTLLRDMPKSVTARLRSKEVKSGYNTAYTEILKDHLEKTVPNHTDQQHEAMKVLGGMFYNFSNITTGIYSNTTFLEDAGLETFNNFANYLVDLDAQVTAANDAKVDQLLPQVEDAITIAAFSWIMENGSTLMRMDNLPKAFGIEGNDLTVPYHIYDMLKAVGSAKPTAAETIGNKVIDMLGFKFTSDVADTRKSKLAVALGQLAVHRMTMAGYVEENTIEPAAVREIVRSIKEHNNQDIDEAELKAINQYTFINLPHSTKTFEPTGLSAKVLNETKGSESVLTKAFGVAPRVKPIRTSKPKAEKLVTQKTTDRLGTQIPSAQVEALSNAHTYKWGINKALNKLHTALGETDALKALRDRMYGKLTEAEINKKQAMKRDGIKANNQSIEREIQIYEASVDTLAKSRFGLDNDFYLEQEVQNQQRSHMANDLNPVASKLHRGLVELKEHRVKFPMTSVERDGIKAFFKTGNTEALLDSQTNTITPLGEFIQTVALLTEDLMPEGVSTTADKTQILNYAPQYLEWALRGDGTGTEVLIILEKMINGDNVPVEQVEKVVAAVNKAGMKAQSLKALVNLISFKNAFTSNKDTAFEVDISLEVDGVTNGPFLTQVLMNTLAAGMYGAGGMYKESDGITNVPQYKDLGNADMYEYNITHLRNAIALAPAKAGRVAYAKNSDVPAESITREVLQAVQVLHPKMLERKGTKTITTVINFSSGNPATAAGIIGDIKDSILSGLEKYSSESVDSVSRKLFIEKLNYLLKRGGLKADEHVKDDADLLNLVLTPQQDKAISKALEEPLMHVVSEFIKEAYPEYIKARDDITSAGQLAVGLFKPVYDAEVAKRTEALPEDVKKVEGLSKEAHEQILVDLRKDMPTFKSYLAGKSTNTEESSLPLVKIASKRSDQARDKSEFYIFGARKVNSLGLNNEDGSFKPSSSSKYTYHVTQQAKTYEIVPAGVANNPKGVHSTDAGIAHTQLGNWVTMNIHDALTAIVGKGRQFAKELNKVTTDALIEVDFNSNMITGSLKPLVAFLGLDSKAQLASKAELQKAAQSINKSHANDVYDAKGNLAPNSSIGDAVALLLDAAFDRDIAKLNTLLEYAYVNQYGLEGGEYKIVESDIKRIEEKLVEVRAKREEAIKQLVPQAVQLDSIFGVVGAKGIYQDAPVAEVTKVAEEKIETGVDKNTTQLYLSNVPKDTPINIKVLNFAIAHDTNKTKDVNPNLATVLSGQMYNLVKQALPEQLEVRVLHATDPRALEHWSKGRYGWFNSNVDGKPVIYLTADANGNFIPAIAIHELMHAVTFLALEKNDTPAAKEITALREQFVKFLANQGITPTDGVAYAIKNNHEFVSTVFERPEVAMLLNQMKVKATRKRGLEDFVKATSKLISQAFGLKPVELESGEITGLEALIGSVLTLSEGAENTKAYSLANVPSSILGASLRKAQQSVKAMNLTDLMEQLQGTGTNFDAQLKETMDEFALPIFDRMDTGLFDSIGLSNDPESVWQDAIATNTTVTSDKAVLSGYILQPLERFAVEAVYAATKAVAKERGLSISYAELDKAFSQARSKIKPKDLFKGDWSKATTAEKAIAQSKWDHLFKITQENDHLARFSSMVSGSAEINALLANVKTESGNKVSKDADINEKVQAYVMKAIEFLAQLISGVKSGAPVSEYVKSALKSVAKVDLKYRGGIVNKINDRISKVENKIDDAVIKARRKVASKIPAMNSTTVPEVTLVRNVATSAIEGTLMDNLNNTRETLLNNSEGKLEFWGELVNEMAENTPFKNIIEKMMRHVKKTSQAKELEKEYTIKNVLSTFKNGGKKLKRKTRESLTYLMVADVSALLGAFTPKQIHRMYQNPEYLNSVISQQASVVMSLDTRGTHLISRSKDLARYMVTNLGPENNDLALNATLIAMGACTANKMALKDVDPDLVAAIDSLVSLYAIRYTPTDIKAEISSVMDTELSRGDVNGIEAILKFHKGLADEARDELFKDNPLSMTKGYIPEITNPNHEIRFAKTDEEAKNFKDQFFREVKVLEPNPLARGDKVRMFLSEDAGLTRMISGTLEMFGKNPRGTDADVDVSVVLKASQAKQRSLHANTGYDPYKGNGTSALIPKYDLDGNVIGYRYEMSSYERDNLLGRDNDFANILGQYAATNFNKMNVPFNNRMVVDALVKEKQENYDSHPDSFIAVGFNVRDKELAKLWDLLPQDTRDYVREVTGKSVLYVPKEVLLPVFGYQKYSATQGFDKPRSERNLYEKVYVALFKAVFGNNARVYGARTERAMQSAVALTKNFIVIRNLRTLSMNIISNAFLLQAHGISMTAIVKDTVYALRAAMQHRKDNALLTAKRQMLYTGLGNKKELEQEVLRLEQAIANNPLAEFINEGMMPSIVDDVALNQDDAFSFKSALERKFEKQLSKIPAGVRSTADWLLVSPTTPLYQFLNNTTQLSDFTAKYVMYNYYRNNAPKKERLDHDAAIQIASDTFINYDMPTSKGMQYLNDMGIIMFSKYNLRIQKALFRLLERKPARALLQALVMHNGTDIPYGIDPIIWNQMGIPFREGALAFPSVIDEPITMNMATSML